MTPDAKLNNNNYYRTLVDGAEAKHQPARHRKSISILTAIKEALGIRLSSFSFFFSFSRFSILFDRLQLALDRNTIHYYLFAKILSHNT